jgi:hypothetical protein
MDFIKVPMIWLGASGFVYILGLLVFLILASLDFTAGFAAGGALVLLNAWAGAWKLKRTELSHKGTAMVALLGSFYIRLIILAVCLYGLIKIAKFDPLGLVIGLTVVPIGLVVMLILIYMANRRPKEV